MARGAGDIVMSAISVLRDMTKGKEYRLLLEVTHARNANFRAVTLFDPRANTRDRVLLDGLTGRVIGAGEVSTAGPERWACGGDAILEHGKEFGGAFVVGSIVAGYECFHCHDDVYRLGAKPEMLGNNIDTHV